MRAVERPAPAGFGTAPRRDIAGLPVHDDAKTTRGGEGAPRPTRAAGLLPALVLVVAGALLYAPSLTTPFVYEDRSAIIENPSIRALWPPWDALAPPRLSTIEGRPAVNVTLAVNYALGGLDVRGYHALNLALHVASALLLFGVTRRTLARGRYAPAATRLAFVVALVWTVHPIQTETVVYTHQRTELLMSFCYLLTLWCAIRYWDSPRSGLWWTAAVAACAAGMGSKEVMATAPVMVLLYDRAFVSGSFGASLRRHRALHAGLAATWVVLAAVLDLREDSVGFHHGVSARDYLLTQAGVIVRYLRLAVWPDPLLISYRWPVVRSLSDALPEALLVLALLVATLWALVRAPRAGFVGGWFFLILAPTSSVLPIVLEVVAERRMYLPLAAVVVAVVLAGHEALALLGRRGRWPAVAGAAAVVAVVIALSVRTEARIRDYRSERILWEGVLERFPDHPEAHNDLAIFLQREGRLDEAIAHYREAIRLKPHLTKAHFNLAGAFLLQGDRDGAIAQYRRVLELDPEAPEAHHALGELLQERGEVTEAIAHYRRALALDRELAEAHLNLGAALASTGRVDLALPHLAEAVRLEPEDVNARYNLGTALALTGQRAPAIGHLEEVVRRQPGNVRARLNLAVLLSGAGETEKAIAHLTEVVRLAPDDEEARRRLAEAMRGRPPAAAAP
jgi:tetratricopeptide (TPR) repeat protein